MKLLLGILQVLFVIGIHVFRSCLRLHRWYKTKQAQKAAPVRAAQVLVTQPEELVLVKAHVSPREVEVYNKPPPLIASQVLTFNLVAQTGLPIGVAWMYLYPDAKKARRVLKFAQAEIATAVCGPKKTRYYFPDIGYIPEDGIKCIQDEFIAAIRSLLSTPNAQKVMKASAATIRASDPITMPPKKAADGSKSKVTSAVPLAAESNVSQRAPTAQQIAEALASLGEKHAKSSANAVASQGRDHAEPSLAQRTSAPAPNVDRSVKGTVYMGTIVQIGPTRKEGSTGQYETYCMTINDGGKEVPLTGVEIKRQALDLSLCVGDKVRVVDMGRQSFTMPSGDQGWRNLFQISRQESA